MQPYIYSSKIQILQNFFKEVKDSKISENKRFTRDNFYSFMATSDFQDLVLSISKDMANTLGFGDMYLIQKIPTPRIFEPNSHGTSFHTDYWYGHGEKAFTVWIPLSKLHEGNTFRIVNPDKNEYLSEQVIKNLTSSEIEFELIKNSYPALPPAGSAVVFSSKHLHGSPKNNSDLTRYSLDFRISPGSMLDKSSNKDPQDYYLVRSGRVEEISNPFNELMFLKYICGGVDKNTMAQHLLIENLAKIKNIKILAQEAEIERFDFPVFKNYLNGMYKSKKINALIVASKSILSENCIAMAKKSNMKIYCALDNIFIN